jgi:hypothetical protein
MTDREVQAIKQFLQEFGYLGCFQIAQRRADRDIMKMSEEQVAQKVLDIRAAWALEGLDVDRLYAVALMTHHYNADRYKWLPACCRPWGEIQPVMPPGRPARPCQGGCRPDPRNQPEADRLRGLVDEALTSWRG